MGPEEKVAITHKTKNLATSILQTVKKENDGHFQFSIQKKIQKEQNLFVWIWGNEENWSVEFVLLWE